MIDMLKGKKDLGTICAMIMLATNNDSKSVMSISTVLQNVQMFLANFYDIEGFLFSILLNEQCFYMLLLLILWAKSIVFAILDALCNYAFQVLDARL